MTAKDKIKAIQKELETLPYSKSKWEELGDLLYHEGRHDEALEAYEFALAIQPDSKQALRMKALLLQMSPSDETVEKGKKILKTYCETYPDDLDTQILLTITLLDENRFEEALSSMQDNFENTIAQLDAYNDGTGTSASLHNLNYSLLEYLREKEDYDTAEDILDILDSIHPDNMHLLILSGGVMFDRGCPQDAEEFFATAMQQINTPLDKEQFLFETGCEYFRAGFYKRAEQQLTRVKDPLILQETYPYLACCALERGEEKRYYQYLAQIDPSGPYLKGIKKAFRNYLPPNIRSFEVIQYLKDIYPRCQSGKNGDSKE